MLKKKRRTQKTRSAFSEINAELEDIKNRQREAVSNSDSDTFKKLEAEKNTLEAEEKMILSVIADRAKETPDGDIMEDYKKIISCLSADIEKYRKELLPFCKKIIEHNNKSEADRQTIVKGIQTMKEAYISKAIIIDDPNAIPADIHCLGIDSICQGATWIIKHIEEGYNGE